MTHACKNPVSPPIQIWDKIISTNENGINITHCLFSWAKSMNVDLTTNFYTGRKTLW